MLVYAQRDLLAVFQQKILWFCTLLGDLTVNDFSYWEASDRKFRPLGSAASLIFGASRPAVLVGFWRPQCQWTQDLQGDGRLRAREHRAQDLHKQAELSPNLSLTTFLLLFPLT